MKSKIICMNYVRNDRIVVYIFFKLKNILDVVQNVSHAPDDWHFKQFNIRV